MKTLGKALANKVATIIIIIVLIVVAFFVVKHFIPNVFGGTTKSQYSFVVKKFSKENELVVANAKVKTTQKQVFTNNAIKKWPSWAKTISSVFVGRNMTVDIPVQTEFKLELKGLNAKDIDIKNGVLTFKKPLTVNVDSQQVGTITPEKESDGLVDKIVDAATSGEKAQEFLSQKSQEAIYKTSDYVMNDATRQKKVVKYATSDLQSLLNLNSENKIAVKIKINDLKFVNSDKKY